MAESQPSGRPPWWRRQSQPSDGPPWWRRHWLALTGLGLIVLLAYAVLAARMLPAWIVSIDATAADSNHRLDAIVNTRNALLGVLAPLVVAIGAIAVTLATRLLAMAMAARQPSMAGKRLTGKG